MKCIYLKIIGVGGQIDFLRGAALSNDGRGKPILAMPSVTKKGESKIVPVVKAGMNYPLEFFSSYLKTDTL